MIKPWLLRLIFIPAIAFLTIFSIMLANWCGRRLPEKEVKPPILAMMGRIP